MHNMYQQMLDRGYRYSDLFDAGYFDSKITDSEVACRDTPYIDADCLIGLSGAFAPVHSGHIHLLHLARKDAEESGYRNVKAVIYPAHDSYVSRKLGNNDWNIGRRLQALESVVKDIPWITIDSYPALYLEDELNFPFIIDRMRKSSSGRLIYAVGGDNHNFHRAFFDSDCKLFSVDRSIKKRTFFGNSGLQNPFIDLSSSSIRNVFSEHTSQRKIR